MEKKSLVIGINSYKYCPTLENCVNDAQDMHSFLASNGFDSKLLIDVAQEELIHTIADFKASLKEDSISVIYFSGHGLQDDKHNYLVAADSEVKRPEDIKYNCVHAEDLLVKNSNKNLHFLILDACRNNPFNVGRKGISLGLSKMNAPAGTLIAFSTSPNAISTEQKGERNGIYTKHLLKNLQTPNLPAELVFKSTRNDVISDTKNKQVPWEESSLTGDDFYFVRIENETIDTKLMKHISGSKDTALHEIFQLLKDALFGNATVEASTSLLTLIKICLSDEEEGITTKTMDSDFATNELIDTYYPAFLEKLIKQDKAVEKFDIALFKEMEILENRNFGYNWLDTPEESFPQMMLNFIRFRGKKGIISFFLTVQDGQHFLKPALFLENGSSLHQISYFIERGDTVNEILKAYFELRKPFEKPAPSWDGFTTSIKEIDEDEFNSLFNSKD